MAARDTIIPNIEAIVIGLSKICPVDCRVLCNTVIPGCGEMVDNITALQILTNSMPKGTSSIIGAAWDFPRRLIASGIPKSVKLPRNILWATVTAVFLSGINLLHKTIETAAIVRQVNRRNRMSLMSNKEKISSPAMLQKMLQGIAIKKDNIGTILNK